MKVDMCMCASDRMNENKNTVELNIGWPVI